jgi:hypothetical protein
MTASQTGEQIAAAHNIRNPLSDDDEDIVADWVTIDVVDPFEFVQIERQYRMDLVCAWGRGNHFLQRALELPAICKASQCVGVCQFVCTALGGNAALDLALLFDHAAEPKINGATNE